MLVYSLSVRTSREQNTVSIHRQRVYDRIVPRKVEHECAFWAFPLFDVVPAGARRGERVLRRMNGERADALLVVRERRHRLARREVPEAHSRVHGACDDLRVGFLALHVCDGGGVAGEDVDLRLGAHVPDARGGVAAGGDEHVERGVEGEGVDAGEMAVVVPDDLVDFEVPALHHLFEKVSSFQKTYGDVARTLSSPHEKRYGWRGETASPRTVEMWPVKLNFSSPEAMSQTLMTRSPAPDTNHLFPGSTATDLTHPRCPEMTRMSFH